ncbi:MAG: MarR family transcriptional regulator [Gammaproteobacteria bacterium]
MGQVAQLDFNLLASPPIARRTDPDSSHVAAARITKSGKRAAQQAAVYSWVRSYPGHTTQELAEICQTHGGTMDRYTFARRAPELAATTNDRGTRRQPLIERGASKRKCSITGELATVWYPVNLQREMS